MKRKQPEPLEFHYVVMETKAVTGTYIEFMPQLWILPPRNKSVVHKERSVVKFLYPRRTPQQTKDNYIKYVKQAKFNFTPPERKEWEMRDGRILKMSLGL